MKTLRAWALLAAACGYTCAVGRWALAADASVPPLLRSPVDIELRSGQKFKRVAIIDVVEGPIANTFRSVEFKDPERAKFYILRDGAVKRIEIGQGRALVYCEKPNLLVLDDDAIIKRVEKQAEALKVKAEAKKKAVKGKTVATAKKPGDSPQPASAVPSRARAWPALTQEQQQTNLAKEEALLADVIQANRLTVTETNFFLFCSDLPIQSIREFSVRLDAMYDELCSAFELEHGRNIWLGKGIVVMFTNRDAFIQFEHEHMRNQNVRENTMALHHGSSDGRVIIVGHTGNEPLRFAHTLVHETAHGFIHRYKSGVHIPSWLNEGAAEWIAGVVVKSPNTKDPNHPLTRATNARTELKKRGSLGGNFFTAENIDTWQYGVATDITMFLLQKPDSYRQLFDGIKQGQAWEESLQASYGFTREELANAYGQWALGIPGLKP